MIGPWAALVVYDLILYVFRAITYEIPVNDRAGIAGGSVSPDRRRIQEAAQALQQWTRQTRRMLGFDT
ncbi:hypothetical protein N0V95_006601 [Ascochyta clinopodiicola]|nr:hypothetical protein N0V95_006601 [Ascochyta clinopodiicola]